MTINDELMIDIKHLLGNRWSVKREDLDTYSRQIRRAAGDMSKLRQSGKGPDGSQVLFPHLPYLLKEEVLISKEEREALLRLREEAKDYDAVVSIGIGGSYLGNQVLFDLFCGPYLEPAHQRRAEGIPPDLFFRPECRSGKFDGSGFLYQKGSQTDCGSPYEGTTPCDFQVWHYH